MDVLIIHHLEPMWESGYRRYGTSFETLAAQFVEHLEENEYDKVILTAFECASPQNEHYLSGLGYFVTDWEEYGYGWEECMFEPEDRGVYYCEGGSHSECVLLSDWMKRLKGNKVFVSGAFDGECIEDLEIALEFLGVEYKRVEELII